ncbi:MAG: zinc metallopeptidase [Pseudomonadota bacterium]
MWVVLALIILAVVFGPNLWVRWVMSSYDKPIDGMPGTGGELAEHLLERFEIDGVGVEITEAGDHYDPGDKKVRLLRKHFESKSLSAVAIAAHEVGHAIQHHQEDARHAARQRLVPWSDTVARASTALIWAAPIIGLLTRHPVPTVVIVAIGMAGLVARMLVHLVTLPVELDASFGKALPILREGQYIAPGEEPAVRRILRAAALTYFAAALADILNLVRWAAMLLRR